jgi:hypothetical protein
MLAPLVLTSIERRLCNPDEQVGERFPSIPRSLERSKSFARILAHPAEIQPELGIVWFLGDRGLEQALPLGQTFRGDKCRGASNQLRSAGASVTSANQRALSFLYPSGALSGLTRMNGVEQMECRGLC